MHLAAAILSLTVAGSASALLEVGEGQVASEQARFLLIGRGLHSEVIEIVEIRDTVLAHFDEHRTLEQVPLDQCVALLSMIPMAPVGGQSMLELADGQRLPGQAKSNAGLEDEVFAWNHAWLGRLDVPLGAVRHLSLIPGARIDPGDSDRVLLANGDLLEGIVVGLGDPIRIEPVNDPGRLIDVPLDRALAVALVTPDREPSGQRVWFRDGTILEVSGVRIGDDGFVRLQSPWLGAESSDTVRIGQIGAILISSGGMQPLAGLSPSRVEGPPDRYQIMPPIRHHPHAPLGLSRLELSGPVVVRYALPVGARRFAAEVTLPREARTWGDLELIVMDDDRIVFSSHLSAAHPVATVNVDLHGSELTIELREGRYGPIQDRVFLDRAMLLVE